MAGLLVLMGRKLVLMRRMLLNLILHAGSVLSVNTGTEPKEPIPNYVGTEFFVEPIGTDFLWNRIYRGTEEPNRSVR